MPKPRQKKTASMLAAELHAGQADNAGKRYIGHLARVAATRSEGFPDATSAHLEAPWLHDAIEDTGTTPESLIAAGMSQKLENSVEE